MKKQKKRFRETLAVILCMGMILSLCPEMGVQAAEIVETGTEEKTETGEIQTEEGAERESETETEGIGETITTEEQTGETVIEEETESISGEGEEEKSTDENVSETNTEPEETETGEIMSETETEAGEMLMQPLADGTGDITRVQWLHELTTVFNMTVEKDNYPDNYYSDIDSSSAYYYDVMLATEFGLIDVEAGEAMQPEAAATREFAAHTLNLCLGYQLEAGSSYTFKEAGEVTYPEDIQVSVNHGWFALNNGAFLPNSAITQAEQAVMLEEAGEVVASEEIDTAYDNQYRFLPDVIVVPEGTQAEPTGESEITITNCPAELAVGSKFALTADGFPVVYRAKEVSTAEGKTVVATELVSAEEAFESIDIQGSIEADLSEAQATNSEVELAYIVGGSQEAK